jgi:hypothetical protein
MNLNPRKLDTISAIMDTVEMTSWRGEKIPGVRLAPGQECLFVQIRLALRAAYPRYPAIAIHFPRQWVDDEPGWKFYAREELANQGRRGDRSVNEITEGLGGK